MLNAIVNIDLYRYEIHALIQAFYPEESVKIWLASDWDSRRRPRRSSDQSTGQSSFWDAAPEEEQVLLYVDYYPDRIELRMFPSAVSAADASDRSQPAESTLDQSVSLRTVQAEPGFLYTEKSRTCKTALKHAIYEMLSEQTGRTLPWGELIGVRPTKIAMTQILKYLENETGEAGQQAGAINDVNDIKTSAPGNITANNAYSASNRALEAAAAYMMQEHLVSPEKAHLAANIAMRERQILSKIDYQDGYSLYIGIPFCPTTCLYCSFPSYSIEGFRDRVDEYLDALEKEIRAGAQMMQELGKKPDTIYIGGGTPTTLEPDQMDRLLTLIEENFLGGHSIAEALAAGKTSSATAADRFTTVFDEAADHSTIESREAANPAAIFGIQEFTVEAGRPDSITREKLLVMKRHGVSRISVNPQTMKEETLRLIGRRHTVQDVIDAFCLAREEGFDNINMDLILGLPEETEEDVARTIAEIEKLSPDSLTVHSLALKRGSRMQEWIQKNGWKSLRNTDQAVRIAAEGAARMGMEPYYLYRQKNISGNFENVGYALPGKAGCYNILIMEEKQSILALGAGSISKAVKDDTIVRSDNAKDITTYLQNIDEMIERKRRIFNTN